MRYARVSACLGMCLSESERQSQVSKVSTEMWVAGRQKNAWCHWSRNAYLIHVHSLTITQPRRLPHATKIIELACAFFASFPHTRHVHKRLSIRTEFEFQPRLPSKATALDSRLSSARALATY